VFQRQRLLALLPVQLSDQRVAGSYSLRSKSRARWTTAAWQRLRLLIERLGPRTSFTYGSLKHFAMFSLLRFTPYVLVMEGLLPGWQEWNRWELVRVSQEEARLQKEQEQRDQDEARRILDAMRKTVNE